MKYIKSYILLLLMVFAVTGCTMDDLKDDVNDLKDRVTLIEQQVKLLNNNLAVISHILDPQNKTISRVETVMENGVATRYVITLSDDTQLTLTIGKPGTIDEPVITIGADNKWYINGVSTGIVAVGQDGKNGEGYPEFRVQGGNWQVRFGTGNWENVPGGEGITSGSLGDQLFESAKVEGDNFIVTLKDGTIHNLAIVKSLTCLIDRSGLTLDADYLVIEKGERAIVPVKIVGDHPQVTYPQGWRATLAKLDAADANGNNYQLYIYAPAAEVKSLARVAADNTADVTVQVQKGAFWAVDKIKVKTPKDYTNNLVKYTDGLAIAVGGLEITKALYGEATEITSDAAITQGGVYFVSTNNVTLTYALPTAGIDHLIIIPTTSAVTTIHLTPTTQIYFTGTLACQRVALENKVANQYPFRVKGTAAQVALDNCKITGLSIGKGLAMPNAAGTDYLSYFEMRKSDVAIEDAGAIMNLVQEMNCSTLIFEDNIIYYAGTVPSAQEAAGHLVYFKLFNGATRTIDTELKLNGNTFVDVESSGSGGVTGLVYSKQINKLTVNNNIYWLTYPATEYGAGKVSTTTVLLRAAATDAAGANNFGYSGNSTMRLQMFFSTTRPVTVDEFETTVTDLFDPTSPATFNKTTGVFIPKAGYTQYGAQR